MPAFSKSKDHAEKNKKPSGILYLGNEKPGGDELWLNGRDVGTHILFLGTTGSGKTEGLKSLVSNALTWGSGFIYIDGKADTNLWASVYALARRFGRDDDLFVLNYLTGNSDRGSVSNTINPFTTGSSSYLTNLLVSLMDEAKGENAMWKGRAVALLGALMPILTFRRDKLHIPLDVKVILHSLSLSEIIRLSRDMTIPDNIRGALSSTYLETLPGYIAAAFDDEGNEAPPGPNDPPRDMSTVSQQHNFLSMQFTRALQSLSGDYWYIFGNQVADVVMQDIVLNRRILVVLIPSPGKIRRRGRQPRQDRDCLDQGNDGHHFGIGRRGRLGGRDRQQDVQFVLAVHDRVRRGRLLCHVRHGSDGRTGSKPGLLADLCQPGYSLDGNAREGRSALDHRELQPEDLRQAGGVARHAELLRKKQWATRSLQKPAACRRAVAAAAWARTTTTSATPA